MGGNNNNNNNITDEMIDNAVDKLDNLIKEHARNGEDIDDIAEKVIRHMGDHMKYIDIFAKEKYANTGRQIVKDFIRDELDKGDNEHPGYNNAPNYGGKRKTRRRGGKKSRRGGKRKTHRASKKSRKSRRGGKKARRATRRRR
jgi:hypothetical protein